MANKKLQDKFTTKKIDKKDKALKEEKIVNDFLLQVTYSILSAIVVLFIYNCRMFNYGTNIGLQTPAIIWSLFGVFAVLTIIGFVKYKTTKKTGYRTFSIYMLISALGMFWCIGVEDFFDLIKVSGVFPGAKQFMTILFWIIGLSVPAEIVAYFVRMTKLKKKA